jgi:hypothetical protein
MAISILRLFLLAILSICLLIIIVIDYKHRKAKLYEPGDFSYYLRLAKTGNKDAKIVNLSSRIAIFDTIAYITTLFF